MIAQDMGHDVLGTAFVPEGAELRLLFEDGQFVIALERTDLMTSRVSASEEALATMACTRLGTRTAPQFLIGGYGMGFTLRAALGALGADAGVTVAELVPEIIQWALGPMAELTDGCLDDPRVLVVEDDVAMLIDAAKGGYDAILLDVDNGPDGLTRRENDGLYSARGLNSARSALTPGGILAVWSAEPDDRFTIRLEEAGFDVSEVVVNEQADGQGSNHMLWFAQRS